MEVQGSGWSARERTVIARVEDYLNKSDCLKLEIDELELLMGPEDSEVVLEEDLEECEQEEQQDLRDIQREREK